MQLLNDDELIEQLRASPDFFERHPELVLSLRLPDPHQGNTVSLLERQTQLLRERVRALEARLAELIHIGRDNDRLALNLVAWTRALLAVPAHEERARVASAEVRRCFGVPLALIRTWALPVAPEHAAAATLVADLAGPRCGADLDVRALGELGPEWLHVRSLALVPLRAEDASPPFGFLLLGSSDPERFEAGLGTAVLESIGALAGAALAGLAQAGTAPAGH